jgi:hypothetical protein
MGFPTGPVANGLRLGPEVVFVSLRPSLIPPAIRHDFTLYFSPPVRIGSIWQQGNSNASIPALPQQHSGVHYREVARGLRGVAGGDVDRPRAADDLAPSAPTPARMEELQREREGSPATEDDLQQNPPLHRARSLRWLPSELGAGMGRALANDHPLTKAGLWSHC